MWIIFTWCSCLAEDTWTPGWGAAPFRGVGALEGAKFDKEKSLEMCSANSALRNLKIQGNEKRQRKEASGFHKVTDYAELEGIHKDDQVQLQPHK